jgi:septation ring formation regulator EzrA
MSPIKSKLQKIKEHGNDLSREIRQRFFSYIMAALGLVAGLSWNETIKSLIEYLFPAQQNTLMAKFSYSVIITIVVVVLSIYLTKLSGRKK